MTDNAATEKPERQERGKGGTRVDPPGYDAGTKIKGKKRHVPVDTQGLLMQAIIQLPTFRTAMAACCRWARCSASIPSC